MAGKLKIEVNLLRIDELTLGVTMNYGADEHGEFHITEIGFICFSISFYYYNQNMNLS